MIKTLQFRINEEVSKDYKIVKHGIYNGFGKMIDLPSTKEIVLKEVGFNVEELGKSFIQIGEKIREERTNIKTLTLNAFERPRVDNRGREFVFDLFYEVEEVWEMKKNKYLALRVILFIGFMAVVLYVATITFIDHNNAYILTAIKDYMIIMSIATIMLFAEFDKDKIREERLKAYKDGYEQGQYDKDMEAE